MSTTNQTVIGSDIPSSPFAYSLHPVTILALVFSLVGAILTTYLTWVAARALWRYIYAVPSLAMRASSMVEMGTTGGATGGSGGVGSSVMSSMTARRNYNGSLDFGAMTIKNKNSSTTTQPPCSPEPKTGVNASATTTNIQHVNVVPSLAVLNPTFNSAARITFRTGPMHRVALALRVTWFLASFSAWWGCCVNVFLAVISVPELMDPTPADIFSGNSLTSQPYGQFCQIASRACILSYGSGKFFGFLFFFAKQRAVRPMVAWTFFEKIVLANTLLVLPFAALGMIFVTGDRSSLDGTCQLVVPIPFIVTELISDFLLSSAYLYLFVKPLMSTLVGNSIFRTSAAVNSMVTAGLTNNPLGADSISANKLEKETAVVPIAQPSSPLPTTPCDEKEPTTPNLNDSLDTKRGPLSELPFGLMMVQPTKTTSGGSSSLPTTPHPPSRALLVTHVSDALPQATLTGTGAAGAAATAIGSNGPSTGTNSNSVSRVTSPAPSPRGTLVDQGAAGIRTVTSRNQTPLNQTISPRDFALQDLVRKNVRTYCVSVCVTVPVLLMILLGHVDHQAELRKLAAALGSVDIAFTCAALFYLMRRANSAGNRVRDNSLPSAHSGGLIGGGSGGIGGSLPVGSGSMSIANKPFPKSSIPSRLGGPRHVKNQVSHSEMNTFLYDLHDAMAPMIATATTAVTTTTVTTTTTTGTIIHPPSSTNNSARQSGTELSNLQVPTHLETSIVTNSSSNSSVPPSLESSRQTSMTTTGPPTPMDRPRLVLNFVHTKQGSTGQQLMQQQQNHSRQGSTENGVPTLSGGGGRHARKPSKSLPLNGQAWSDIFPPGASSTPGVPTSSGMAASASAPSPSTPLVMGETFLEVLTEEPTISRRTSLLVGLSVSPQLQSQSSVTPPHLPPTSLNSSNNISPVESHRPSLIGAGPGSIQPSTRRSL